MNGDPAEKLGEHIATFLWRGIVSLEDELFTVFWSNAPATTRGHMVEFFGRSAREELLTPNVQERLMSFWRFAKESVRTGEGPETLRGFAWWFGASDLPAEWRLAEVNELLGEKIEPQPAFLVAEQLPAITDEHPRETLRVLRLLIENGDVWPSMHGASTSRTFSVQPFARTKLQQLVWPRKWWTGCSPAVNGTSALSSKRKRSPRQLSSTVRDWCEVAVERLAAESRLPAGAEEAQRGGISDGRRLAANAARGSHAGGPWFDPRCAH